MNAEFELYSSLASQIICRFPMRRIVTDSRRAAPGDIFVAVSGVALDGRKFIPQAVEKGAAAIIYSGELENFLPGVEYIEVPDSRKMVPFLYREFYGMPDRGIKLYSVTGTNGKTTCAFLLNFLLQKLGVPCGLFSTVEYQDGRNCIPASHTTPDAEQFFELLARMKNNSLQAAAMESSSHALALNRLDSATISGAIFTNLTGDHLDFHGTMEQYFAAKCRLFTDLLKAGGTAAVNIDDPYGRRLFSLLPPTVNAVSFGSAPDAAYRITGMHTSPEGVYFDLCGKGMVLPVASPLAGEYNIHNLAGVLTLLSAEGFAPEQLVAAAALPFQVPGRLEKVEIASSAAFFVDFAHTDDALKNVLSTVKPFVSGKLWVIFGAGGDRDKSKRPRMGAVASQYADRVIITSDNPRSEEPEEIISQIRSGISGGAECYIEVDRRKALELAVKNVSPGDVVIVAGKGHENYQEISGVKYPFDDRQELKNIWEKCHG